MRRILLATVLALSVGALFVGCDNERLNYLTGGGDAGNGGDGGDGGGDGGDGGDDPPAGAIPKVVLSTDSAATNQVVDVTVVDTNDGDANITASYQNYFCHPPDAGKFTFTRDTQGKITDVDFSPRIGGGVVVGIVSSGKRYTAFLRVTTNEWLSLDVHTYRLGVSSSLQLVVNRYVGQGLPTDITNITNFSIKKRDGTGYLPSGSTDDPIADLSISGLLTGKATGYVTVRFKRDWLVGEATFCVGSPTATYVVPTMDLILAKPDDIVFMPALIKPGVANGYGANDTLLVKGLYDSASSSDHSVTLPNYMGGTGFEILAQSQAQATVSASHAGVSLNWEIHVLADYLASTPQSGYGLVSHDSKTYLVVDEDLVDDRILEPQNLGDTNQDILAYFKWDTQFQEYAQSMRINDHYLWELPSGISSGQYVDFGLHLNNKYTPEDTPEDRSFYGSHWVSNGAGGGDIALQTP